MKIYKRVKISEKTMKKKTKKQKNKILSIGAEAVLYLNKKENRVIKERKKKKYRIPEIDNRLRSSRTRREAKVLEKLSPLHFTPNVLFADNESVLEIEYINGKRLSECLEKEAWENIGEEIGKKIKQIHDRGIIHGDLTTSNLILKKSPAREAMNKIFFIDFGLSFFSQKTEDKAVDLHVLEEALESKHYTISKKMFAAVNIGYNDPTVLNRLEEVEARGRNKKGS